MDAEVVALANEAGIAIVGRSVAAQPAARRTGTQ